MSCRGTIAGWKFGIAKNANLIAVKVLNDKGCVLNSLECHCLWIQWIMQVRFHFRYVSICHFLCASLNSLQN